MKTHIFFVDDDIEEMKLFVAALNEVGDSYKCTYASNGIHALKMLHYLRPETIFISYNMPVMNGLVLIDEIRKNNDFKNIPVCLYYSNIDNHSMQKALELNATQCMKKPSSKINMVNLLKKFFQPADAFSLSNA